MSERLSGAVSPPLILAAWAIAGFGAMRLWPVGIPGAEALRLPAKAIGAGGVLLVIWCMFELWRHKTSPDHDKPTAALVTSGPFRFSRNPMYVGFTLIMIGTSIVYGSLWPLLLAPLAVLALQRLTIDREEAYLKREFGDHYDRYRARVRTWL